MTIMDWWEKSKSRLYLKIWFKTIIARIHGTDCFKILTGVVNLGPQSQKVLDEKCG